ncbi:MAG: hypothetical protein H6932_01935 [Burkholderiaceae bacterium]|nr:hypothetical protein [Burkholderiaceae bacterium]
MTRFSKSTLAAAAAMALAACGGGGGGDGGGGGTSNTPPVANAGADILASRTTSVTLDGRASSDADGNTLTYRWRQTAGVDVTGGSGVLEGATPSFTAPTDVQTLEFELVVNDGTASSPGDRLTVHVLEDAANALFVDATAGSDSSGTGAMDAPYATIRHALAQVGSSQGDLYLRSGSGQSYDESGSTLAMPSGTSLYGGYGSGWVRDAEARKAEVRTNSAGVQYTALSADTEVSGLDIRAAGSSAADEPVHAVSVAGNGSVRFTLRDSVVTAGSVGPGATGAPASSYGVALRGLDSAVLSDNTVTAGAGGAGASGNTGSRGANGSSGANGNRDGGRRAGGGSRGPRRQRRQWRRARRRHQRPRRRRRGRRIRRRAAGRHRRRRQRWRQRQRWAQRPLGQHRRARRAGRRAGQGAGRISGNLFAASSGSSGGTGGAGTGGGGGGGGRPTTWASSAAVAGAAVKAAGAAPAAAPPAAAAARRWACGWSPSTVSP